MTKNIPKGMVELEHILDHDESIVTERMLKEKGIEEHDSYNLGTDEDPKIVRVGKACNAQERKDILKFITQYKDVISQSY